MTRYYKTSTFATIVSCFLLLAAVPCPEWSRTARPLKEAAQKERPKNPEVLTFYAMGDWGTGDTYQKAVSKLLENDLQELEKTERSQDPFILGLGDVNYYAARSDRGWENRERTERALQKNFAEAYKDVSYRGHGLIFYIVPGNHEHRSDIRFLHTIGEAMFPEANPQGHTWQVFPRNAASIEDSNDENEFHGLGSIPMSELSLPQEIPLKTNLVKIVALDTTAIIDLYHQREKKKVKEQWQALEEALGPSHSNQWRILIGHHPIQSHGKHGTPLSFTQKLKALLGDLSRQRLYHNAYRGFRKDFIKFLNTHPVDLYLAGHDHSLQLLDLGKSWQVISGAAAKSTEVTSCSDTIFAKRVYGLVRLDATDEELWVEYKYLDKNTQSSKSKLYRFEKIQKN